MAYPTSDHTIDTPYGRRGHSWSCSENSSGGIHTGDDFAVASNTPLYAAIAGTIRHRNYGSSFGDKQFAISPSSGQPFAAGEVFYAHGNERLADGTEVQVGDYVGKSGKRGNATGPHLHFEFHPNSKNVWNCSAHADPSKAGIYSHGSSSSGGGGGGEEYPKPTSNIVYVSKLKFGQEKSDSVWYLQYYMNLHSLAGGATLPTTGNYFDMTDAEVIKCQSQHGFGADAPGTSFVGPKQAEHLFAGSGITVVYDTGNPDPGPTPPPTTDRPAAPAVLLPGAVWDPISNFTGLRPFKGGAKKITLHTTETDVKPNWEQQQSGIPHLTLDLGSGQRWQHLDFGIAAYTLSGGDHSPNSDSGQNIQIEIIGRTSQCPSWPQSEYSELEDVIEWLCNMLGIPFEFPLSFTSPKRQSWSAWEPVSGVLGHCHAPYNDHTDPTGLRTDLIVPPPPEPNPGPPAGDYVTKAEFDEFKTGVHEWMRRIVEATNDYLDGY